MSELFLKFVNYILFAWESFYIHKQVRFDYVAIFSGLKLLAML